MALLAFSTNGLSVIGAAERLVAPKPWNERRRGHPRSSLLRHMQATKSFVGGPAFEDTDARVWLKRRMPANHHPSCSLTLKGSAVSAIGNGHLPKQDTCPGQAHIRRSECGQSPKVLRNCCIQSSETVLRCSLFSE